MAVSWNKYSFYHIHRPTPFCIKTNLRENRFFAARWAIWLVKRVLIMLNFLQKSWQDMVSWQVNKKTSGQVNKLIVLFSLLEKCVFSAWQCPSKLDRVQLAYWKRSFLVCWHKHVHFWHKNIRNIKKRSLLFPHYVPLTVRFQLVANALNGLRQATFSNITAFCHRQMWQDYSFYCIFVQYFVHERSVCLGFTA